MALRSHPPTCIRCGPIVVLSCVCGCFAPPMNVGYVSTPTSRRGGVDVQGQAFGGGMLDPPTGFGGGSAVVEPFVTPELSIPIGASVAGTQHLGYAPLRVGLRHRFARHFAWGFGAGPSLGFTGSSIDVSGTADVEFIGGFERDRLGLSVAIRPAFAFAQADGFDFYGIVEPTASVRVGQDTRLTLGVIAGPFVSYLKPQVVFGTSFGGTTVSGFAAGSLGVHRRF